MTPQPQAPPGPVVLYVLLNKLIHAGSLWMVLRESRETRRDSGRTRAFEVRPASCSYPSTINRYRYKLWIQGSVMITPSTHTHIHRLHYTTHTRHKHTHTHTHETNTERNTRKHAHTEHTQRHTHTTTKILHTNTDIHTHTQSQCNNRDGWTPCRKVVGGISTLLSLPVGLP